MLRVIDSDWLLIIPGLLEGEGDPGERKWGEAEETRGGEGSTGRQIKMNPHETKQKSGSSIACLIKNVQENS